MVNRKFKPRFSWASGGFRN